MSGAGPEDTAHNPVTGWAAAPLAVLMVVVLLFIGFFVAYAVILWTG